MLVATTVELLVLSTVFALNVSTVTDKCSARCFFDSGKQTIATAATTTIAAATITATATAATTTIATTTTAATTTIATAATTTTTTTATTATAQAATIATMVTGSRVIIQLLP